MSVEEFFAELNKLPIGERMKVWGSAYRMGNEAYERDPRARKEIDDINRHIYNRHANN